MTQLTLLSEMWSAVKESIISSDRAAVADNVIAMLIDHDISIDEIRRTFRGEGDIIDALKFYADADAEGWDKEDEDDSSDEIDYYFGDDDEDDDWS